jgi:hypothetical protein
MLFSRCSCADWMPEIWASTYNSSKHDGHHRGLINNGKQGERWHSTDGVASADWLQWS